MVQEVTSFDSVDNVECSRLSIQTSQKDLDERLEILKEQGNIPIVGPTSSLNLSPSAKRQKLDRYTNH